MATGSDNDGGGYAAEGMSARSKWMLAAGLGAILVLAAGAAGMGSGNEAPPAQEKANMAGQQASGSVDEAARAGLQTLRELSGGGGPGVRLNGVAADSARTGSGLDVYAIGLDALKAAAPGGGTADRLLTRTGDTIVPVMVGGTVGATVTVSRTARGYEATAFGESKLGAGPAAAAPPAGAFLVRVPALGLEFIGTRANGKLMLSGTTADPRLRLEPGRAVPADELLPQLKALAQASNGLPM